MNHFISSFIVFMMLFLGGAVQSNASAPTPQQIQKWVLQSMKEMPAGGEHNLGEISGQRLMESFEWKENRLVLNAEHAKPGYCTIATYMVFFRTLEKYWKWAKVTPHLTVYKALKAQMEKDGERLWGRWNSNGPGTAKLIWDSRLGYNFESLDKAKPGDFLKLFRTYDVGKHEKGHAVIYLGQETRNGVLMIRYWSNNSGKGYSEDLVPASKFKRFLFTRLTSLESYVNLVKLSPKDDFLASMLTQVSSWDELRKSVGL